jgi:hypothetical protein
MPSPRCGARPGLDNLRTHRQVQGDGRSLWAAVTDVLAEAGQHESAAAIARSITNPDDQVRALLAVVRALARADQHEPAAAMVRSITDSYEQARALAAVARALVAKGIRDRRAAASAACTVGQWTTVLELVLLLEPSALTVLTDL